MSPWTDEMVVRLREMWMDHTATEIGAAIGKSRNAVIGKVHRLGLPTKAHNWVWTDPDRRPERKSAKDTRVRTGRVKPRKKTPNLFHRMSKPPKPRPVMEPPPPPVEPLLVPLMELRPNQCHFIPGEPSGGYCGHPVHRYSMCAFHVRLCRQPREERLRDAA